MQRRKIILGILAGIFLTAGLWSLNLSTYHYYGADFPNDPDRRWHLAWGNRFLCLALIFFVGFFYSVWRIKKTKNAA